VVGVPADRLRMRDGLIVRNGDAVEESFADVSDCLSGCDFPRAITVPAGHFFVLGDNRGQSWDSRFWGPVPARALLGRVTGCITEAGEPCAVEARHVGRASAAPATQSVPHGLSITKRQVPSA
jgi:signal peptidase I